MIGQLRRALAGAAGGAAVSLLAHGTAQAVPSFAAQTGLPCASCHVGAFGPQLTPIGRAFKIGGYTQDGGQGPLAKVPLAAFVLGSFTNTASPQPAPAATHFGRNNNPALDQISVFLAGRASEDIGGFVQGTYSGIDHSTTLDNSDLRLTHPFDLGASEVRLGLSLNSGPTVQDPYNTTPAWGFPFAASALAPTPAVTPLLDGGLIGNSAGLTLYGWYDRSLYVEAGAYVTRGPTGLRITGATLGPGATAQPAPYGRVAYEWNWNGQSAHVGALGLLADLNPTVAPRRGDGSLGHDRYADIAADAGYQFIGTGRHVATFDVLVLHEDRSLQGSVAQGIAGRADAHLNEVSAFATYFFEQTYGVLAGWKNIWGTADPVLLAPAPVTGSANGSPNSNAFIVELDWVPFGKAGSWGAPLANLRLGIQDTVYTRFNGRSRNFDGFGRDAAGNNTLFVYAWTAF
jgi:hypothetical protein